MAFLIYLLIFISFTDLFAQLPITSIYASHLGAASGFIGFIVGAYSLSNLLSNLFSGQLVDCKGPKNVLLGGFLINAIILFLYAFVQTPEQLLIVRFLNGLSAGVITPAAFTYLTLFNKDKKAGRTMAFSGAAVGIAAIGGPTFSGIVSARIGQEIVYTIVGIFMIIGFILTLILKPVHQDEGEQLEKDRFTPSFIDLFKNKGLMLAFIGALSLSASQGILAYMLPLKILDLEISEHMSGILMSIFGVVAILFFLLPTNRIYDKFPNEFILPIGLMVVAASDTLTSLAPGLSIIVISMCIYGIGFALIFPSMSALVSKYSPQNMRGKAFGVFYAFYSLGSFLGSSITGSFSLTPNGGFISAAVFLIIVSIGIVISVKKLSMQSVGK